MTVGRMSRVCLCVVAAAATQLVFGITNIRDAADVSQTLSYYSVPQPRSHCPARPGGFFGATRYTHTHSLRQMTGRDEGMTAHFTQQAPHMVMRYFALLAQRKSSWLTFEQNYR